MSYRLSLESEYGLYDEIRHIFRKSKRDLALISLSREK